MPTSAHQVPLLVLRERPEILLELLGDALVTARRGYDRVVDHSNDLSSLTPVELTADLVLAFYEGDNPSLVIVVEVQRAADGAKLRVWPSYVGELVKRFGCSVYLVVVAEDRATAEWAGEPNPFFHPSSPFVPLVLGPAEVPVIRTVEEARKAKELALLSLAVHAGGPEGAAIMEAVLPVAQEVGGEYKILCVGLLMQLLSEMRKVGLELRLGMNIQDWLRNNENDLIRNTYRNAYHDGEAHGTARLLLRLWQRRFGATMDEPLSGRIQAEHRRDLLDSWFDEVATAVNAAEAAALRERILATPLPPPELRPVDR